MSARMKGDLMALKLVHDLVLQLGIGLGHQMDVRLAHLKVNQMVDQLDNY